VFMESGDFDTIDLCVPSLLLAVSACRIAQDNAAADSPQITSWFGRLTGGSSSSSSKSQQPRQEQLQQQPDPSPSSGAAAWQQQQQQQWAAGGGSSSGAGEPLSGAIALLSDEGLTNHPLDYNPITNEHTAAMTLAKQSGIEAYNAGRCGWLHAVCTGCSKTWALGHCNRVFACLCTVLGCC
jgi:hypothetical protein